MSSPSPFRISLRLSAQAPPSGCWDEGHSGWHTSKELVVPEGIHLLFLPPYAPELHPYERLWPLTNEGVANQSFRTLDELEAAQVQRCVVLQDQPEMIRSLTHFHWWPLSNSKHQ